MALVKRKVANPVPSVLALVNPKGGKSMATKRRKTSAPKKRHTKAPARKTASVKTHHTTAAFKGNPTKKRRTSRRHHRNPLTSGVVSEGLKLGASGVVIGIGQRFVRPLVGGFVGNSPIAQAGVTLGTAYGLGWLANLTSFTRPYRRYLELAGWTISLTQLITSYAGGFINSIGGAAPQGMQGGGWARPYRRGLNGIAAIPNVPPALVPPPPKQARQGMQGVSAIPGRFAR